MKLILSLFVLFSFSATASPLVSVKERLRLHMWVYGLQEDSPVKKQVTTKAPSKEMPEELARALRKI